MKFYLYCFAFLVLMVNYSCKKSTDDNAATPGNPSSGDTTKPGVTPIFNISRSAVFMGNDAGYVDTIGVGANVEWKIGLSAGADAWLKAELDKSSLGAVIGVKLTVIKTNTGATQTATLTVTPVNAGVAPRQVTITQNSYSLIWQKCYGGSGPDHFGATLQLSNGQFLSGGFSASTDGDALGNSGYLNGWIVNTDVSGNKIWQGGYDGTFSAIVATADGGIIGAGDISISGRATDIGITKVDALGKLVWKKSYGGTGYDYARNMIGTTDGGVIVAGFTNSTDGDIKSNYGSFDLWLIKLNADGNVVWQKNYGGTGADLYSVITPGSDGGFILCGTTDSNNSGDVPAGKGYDDILVIKIDANGNKVWSKTYGGSGDETVYKVIGDADGGYILAGNTDSNNGDVTGSYGGIFNDAWVIKIDRNGLLKWQATLGGTKNDYATDLVRLPNGNFAIVCTTESNDGDMMGNHGLSDVGVVELNSMGKRVWKKVFGSSDYDSADGVLLTQAGEILVTAYTRGNDGDVSGNHGDNDAWLFKLK